jgi:hypothetical protein
MARRKRASSFERYIKRHPPETTSYWVYEDGKFVQESRTLSVDLGPYFEARNAKLAARRQKKKQLQTLSTGCEGPAAANTSNNINTDVTATDYKRDLIGAAALTPRLPSKTPWTVSSPIHRIASSCQVYQPSEADQYLNLVKHFRYVVECVGSGEPLFRRDFVWEQGAGTVPAVWVVPQIRTDDSGLVLFVVRPVLPAVAFISHVSL